MDDPVALVARALEAARPRAGTTRVIAVDGPSGAGKTDLANRLGLPVVHLEDLYPGWDGLEAGIDRLVEGVLRPLAVGRPAGYRRYDWTAGRDAERVEVPPVPDLVVEGVGAGARACAPYLGLLVWVDAPEAVRHARAMARDGELYRPHWDRWAERERRYFAADDPEGRAGLRFGFPASSQDPGVH